MRDVHIHFLNWSRNLSQVDLATTQQGRMLERIAVHAQRPPAGADVGQAGTKAGGAYRLPHWNRLADVTGPQQPAIFWRSDMLAPSSTTERWLAGITAGTPNLPGVIDKDAEGRPQESCAAGNPPCVGSFRRPPDEIAPARSPASPAHARHHAIHDQRMKSDDDGPGARLPAPET